MTFIFILPPLIKIILLELIQILLIKYHCEPVCVRASLTMTWNQATLGQSLKTNLTGEYSIPFLRTQVMETFNRSPSLLYPFPLF